MGRVVILTAALIALALVETPVRGDESCAIPSAAGENEVVYDELSDELSMDDDDEKENANTSSDDDDKEEDIMHPVWWNYTIDELFEDLFDCGELIYGYQTGKYADSDDEDDGEDGAMEADAGDDDSEGRSDPDFDDDRASPNNPVDDNDEDLGEEGQQRTNAENKMQHAEDVVSKASLRKIQRQWAIMREKYVREVNLVPVTIHYNWHESGKGKMHDFESEDDDDDGENTIISNRGVSALVVPSRIGDAGPEKGRGVFAARPIREGELVSSLDNGSTAVFKDGRSWREFAATLPDAETACNFIEWSWVQTIVRPGGDESEGDDIRNGLTIFASFDESNLLNAADWDGVEANVRCGAPPTEGGGDRGPCRYHYYAARDIAEGEELLINYGEFEDLSQQGWTDMGL